MFRGERVFYVSGLGRGNVQREMSVSPTLTVTNPGNIFVILVDWPGLHTTHALVRLCLNSCMNRAASVGGCIAMSMHATHSSSCCSSARISFALGAVFSVRPPRTNSFAGLSR